MITIPASLDASRSHNTEKVLLDRTREWLMKEERSPGIHASDLLDPLQAYWRHLYPQPIGDRQVPIFMIGKVLHAFLLSAVDGEKGTNWASDQGSKTSEIIGIAYSQDHNISGIPREVKTSRSFYEPKGVKDLDMYIEQLLIYMAAEKSTKGQLWVLYINLKDEKGRTSPEFRAYTITITPEDLEKVTAELKEKAEQLKAAIAAKSPAGLSLCRQWKCGERMCEFWNQCKPDGRFPLKTQKSWKA